MRDVLETRHHPLHGRMFILSYGEFLSLPELPRATYLFLDIERLTPDRLAATPLRIAQLEKAMPGTRILNRPDRIVDRLTIMQRLWEAGINGFRVMPVTAPPEDLRYPVFLRGMQDHEGPRSTLIGDAAELDRAVAALNSPDGFAITEYIDARNAEGLHEKRSYMRVGDRLFPAARDVSRNWVCKGEYSNPEGVAQPEIELAFLTGTEDRDALRRAFDVTRIDYGRADYAVVDGRPQLFEINTNPWVEPPEGVPAWARRSAGTIVSAWLDAVEALDAESGIDRQEWVPVGGAVPVPIPPGFKRRNIVHKLLLRSGQLHRETGVMRRLRRVRFL
ncbi:hypothetical protein [Paracoccus sp. S1E-3]|uniref:hypothetical protein n=1 Tax=Paracoccus sp. S1E-3 TaxID=2756130 RepID=UPI001C693CB7|nr:hypothetical protein [Paracoccus sp. S1E-3]